ncbi:flavodoxin domain-containing protein [Amycolatopsis sp. GM8]|uniref:flavodoxin family protein n=1 Tax=Amycolatopsis sp. GM8 TaxID=2896530 RepID=UPI001F027033|nr:flavodoxin domain-containing protein [Amycolatopsis sp. GM8]
MRVLIVYESMFGTTELIAKAVAEGLRPAGEVAVTNVDDAPAQLGDVDLLVVGGPTHVHGMSRPSTRESAAGQAEGGALSRERGIREWLGSLGPAPDGLAVAVFDTRLDKARWLVGSAAHSAANVLRRHGYQIPGKPQSFFVTSSTPPELAPGELERAREWGETLLTTTTAKA